MLLFTREKYRKSEKYMKLLFVQLSDMHCKSTDKELTQKLVKAVNAIKMLGKIDHAVLIFSGDLTDANTENEYKTGQHLIDKFISDLSNALDCGVIHTEIVPGNHDMDLPEGCRDAAIIETWNEDEHLEEELNRLGRFFDYAKTKHCFVNDKLCDVSILELGNTKVQICKLNSSPFSTRKPDDKQFHYFPSSVGENLQRNPKVDLKVTIMHHHFEWCEWNTKEMLKSAIATDDITFFGHDHKAEMLTTQYGNGLTTNIIMGGRFDLDLRHNAAFNTVIYDDEAKTIQTHEFVWSIEGELFIPKTRGTIEIRRQELTPTQEYLQRLLGDDQGICESILDYYALPKLSAEGGAFSLENSMCEISVEEIFETLKEVKAIRITGGTGAGKTALLKYLYYMSIDVGFIPLFIENRDYRDSRIDKMFKDLFDEQYGEPNEYAYIAYLQADGNSKIVFIDNIDLIKNTKACQNLVNTILESGRLLIYTTRDRNQDLEETVKNKIEGKEIATLEICPMYKETRDCLVDNVGRIFEKPCDEVEAVKASLDYMVQCQTGVFTFTPSNTLQYIKYFFQGGAKDKKGTQTISVVFETNIRNSILKACKKDPTANLYLLLLEFLADQMYFNLKTELIGFDQFMTIIAEYNAKRKADVNAKHFLTICIEANILKQPSDSFSIGFYDKNTYAYFVAKALNRQFEKQPGNLAKLQFVMEHICFGINDTIIVFLSFIRSNTQIILKVAEQAQALLAEYPEWNFVERNIPFLHQTPELTGKMPSPKERKEAHQQTEKIEKERHDIIKFRGIFDYDENDVKKPRYLVARALKYTQLVGRAFVDQFGALEADEIDKLVETLYTAPQKIIFAVLKPYQEHCEQIVKSLCSFAEERIPEAHFTEEKIRELFGAAGTVLALNIMNDIAFNAANENTINVLRKWPAQNDNHKIFELMLEENTGNTAEFVQKAIALRKELEKSPFAKMLIAQIARKHIIYNGSIDHREVSKLLSGKVLAASNKPGLLLSKGTGAANQ